MVAPQGHDDQPISHVEWVPVERLHANDYNPNVVAPVERQLLRLSLLEDGWTQPIVARHDDEIVDGFHRWTLASTDDEVFAMTGGQVPVVRLAADLAPAQQRMATIRHNRARGTHHVVRMADIVAALVDDMGLGAEEVAARLGMEAEEVERLYQRGSMIERGAGTELGKGWVPQ